MGENVVLFQMETGRSATTDAMQIRMKQECVDLRITNTMIFDNHFLTFAVAATLLTITPGNDTFLVLNRTLTSGRRCGVAATAPPWRWWGARLSALAARWPS